MRTEHRWPLFRICFAALATRGSCWLLLAGMPLFGWLAPLLTPWEENPQILQPARAQAAWTYAWLALLTWLPFQATALGHRLHREGMLEHFRAGGKGPFNLWAQMSAAILVWMLALMLAAMVVCVTICLPKQPAEAQLWVNLVMQYGALYTLAGIPLVMLAVALGTRTAEVIAFLAPVALLIVGLFGAAWLTPLLGPAGTAGLRTFWLALPHYHLADLTSRLVFKMGPLTSSDFIGSATCLALQGAALCLFSRCLFRTRS